MLDFDSLPATTTRTATTRKEKTGAAAVEVVSQAPQVESVVTVTPVRQQDSATHLINAGEQWTWQQLRDYVVTQIQHFHGPQPSNPVKEKAIFSGFLSRWGSDAVIVARAAFEVHDGMWHSAPISVNRFCKASDAYFAAPILDRVRR